MKYKCWCFFFVCLLIFACNNSSDNNNNGNLEYSSSSSENSVALVSSSSETSSASEIISSAFDASSSSSSDSPSEISSAFEASSSSEISSSSPISSSSEISSSSPLSSAESSPSSSSEAPPEIKAWPTLKEGQSGVLKGWGSRYWDGCKPHCALRNNIDTNATPFKICRNCNKNNKEIPTFTLSPDIEVHYQEWDKQIAVWWLGYKETVSSCEKDGISYVCWDMAPLALNDTLAYAFVAGTLKKPVCGHCFQVQFDGGNHGNDIKDAHRKLKGKTLIVMATNTGGDVEEGQFDIMVPGGGPGMFDSFAEQIGVPKNQLGEGFGGFLTTCQREINDYNKPAEVYQECVRKKC
ncbi:MAG: hypothetical protein FWF63_02510, partial [Fibromonadales bacterium]|nr:hypothetical protein [Fibromonadales bacterium]